MGKRFLCEVLMYSKSEMNFIHAGLCRAYHFSCTETVFSSCKPFSFHLVIPE
jgi:hypothetical protein